MKNPITKILTIYKNFPAYIKRYIWPLPKFRKEIVVMIDGTQVHGGLTDRFRHIMSIYSYCKENNIKFHLYYEYPCNIQLLLCPNKYDWRIQKNDISYNYFDYKELYLYVEVAKGEKDSASTTINNNNKKHLYILDKELSKTDKTQYHIYGNTYFAKGKYRELFYELFIPTEYLKDRIELYRKKLYEPYESISLRFQQLLCDLKEGYNNKYKILPPLEREELINKCIEKIKRLYDEGYFSTTKVLITSDSSTFIERVSILPFVYTIPGKMEHMDFTQNNDLEMNSKAFVDLFLLSEAQKLTLLKTGEMYRSGFPEFAAELGGKPINYIEF